VVAAALSESINVRLVDDNTISISCDEVTRRGHVVAVWRAFGLGLSFTDVERLDVADPLPDTLTRTSPFLSHPVFSAHRSETSMLRYLRRLADRDYALIRHDPARLVHHEAQRHTEMEPISLPGFASLHPFAPVGSSTATRSCSTT